MSEQENKNFEERLKIATEALERIKDSYHSGDLDEVGINCLCEEVLEEIKGEE